MQQRQSQISDCRREAPCPDSRVMDCMGIRGHLTIALTVLKKNQSAAQGKVGAGFEQTAASIAIETKLNNSRRCVSVKTAATPPWKPWIPERFHFCKCEGHETKQNKTAEEERQKAWSLGHHSTSSIPALPSLNHHAPFPARPAALVGGRCSARASRLAEICSSILQSGMLHRTPHKPAMGVR